ncbi:STAS domain-containing protein [Streptomyces sp. NBC_01275]|uniref:STAS domain-containing protein n=1 Tax=Streptomyces sp. NBC_01275 TaxID=2903807 RepID=UPI00224D1822|nr:STAS domain-containing protein [Streptomyces sp. NBC_01275]MCX4767316.1 STAS domain-containing protein [Streptomyces sp. NBC_01275]
MSPRIPPRPKPEPEPGSRAGSRAGRRCGASAPGAGAAHPGIQPAQPGRLTVSHSTVDGVRIVALYSELDHAAHDYVDAVLRPAVGDAPPRTVADLSGLTFMDSSGINALVNAHRAAVDARGRPRVAGTRPPVLRVMELAGIDALIPCRPTVGQALGN